QRIAFHLLKGSKDDAQRLAAAVAELLDAPRPCSGCNALTDRQGWPACSGASRAGRVICVVEEPHNLVAVERTRDFRGRYHVLHGALSPLQGVGPDQLKLKELLARLHGQPASPVQEIIIATDPTVEGEATALYLARLIKPLGIRATRIAQGVPMGGDLEYADQVTLARALAGRREV